MNREKEVFLIEHQGKAAIFAPLKGVIFEISDYEKSRVNELLRRSDFVFQDLLRIFPEIDKSRLLSQENESKKLNKETEGFFPTSVVMFTTFNCHLRCIYCYSEAGEQKIKANMNWEIAKSAVDLIIGNALRLKQKECSIEFHGGGEPTWNWSIFRLTVDYFQACANEKELVPKISIVTNGMLSEKQIEWIVEHDIRTIQISLDGPEAIHNLQRPTIGGGKSFSVVYRTAKSFLAKGVEIMIHSVVTKNGVDRIPEIVRFFGEKFPSLTVQIEPMCPCGRGLTTGQQFPSPEMFARGFIDSLETAKSYGIELVYSGASSQLTEIHESFCGVSEPNFVVTPIGLVTACHEVAEPRHPLANRFIYGYWNQKNGGFVFDYQKIRELRALAQERDSLCCECFAQFYCAGECLVKSINDNGKKDISFLDSRCRINRELTKHHIFSRLFGG